MNRVNFKCSRSSRAILDRVMLNACLRSLSKSKNLFLVLQRHFQSDYISVVSAAGHRCCVATSLANWLINKIYDYRFAKDQFL